MKLITVISEDESEEIIIKCKSRSDKILLLEAAIGNVLKGQDKLSLYIAGTEYFVSKSDVLFFETEGGKVFAHTVQGMYSAPYKLFELEDIMPSSFVRISKSAVANVALISSLHRELTGNGEMTFKGCDKKVYFSRGYYKLLRNKIDEMRFEK